MTTSIGIEVNVANFATPNTTDWTSAIQAAVNSLPSQGGRVYLPTDLNWFSVSGTITIPNGGVVFDGNGNTIILSADVPLFRVCQVNTTLQNFRVLGRGISSNANNYVISTDTAAGNLLVRNVTMTGVGSGIKLKGTFFRLDDVSISEFSNNGGIGIYINQVGVGDGIGFINQCVVTGSPNDRPFAAVFADSGSAIQITSCEFMQTKNSLYLKPLPGSAAIGSYTVVNTFFDTFNDSGVIFDSSNSPGVHFQRMRFSSCWISNGGQAVGTPIAFNIPAGTIVDSLIVSDCEFYGNHVGFLVGDNCHLSPLLISNSVFGGNKQADISIGLNNQNFTLNGCYSGPWGGFSEGVNGVYINPNCKNYIITNNRIRKFTDLGTTPKVVANNLTS